MNPNQRYIVFLLITTAYLHSTSKYRYKLIQTKQSHSTKETKLKNIIQLKNDTQNKPQLNSVFENGQRLDPGGKKIKISRNDNGIENLPIYNQDLAFNLLVTYWDKHNRLDDFKISFEHNIKNPLIKKIFIFYEQFSGKRPSFMESDKVIIIPIPKIAQHKTFYEFANVYLANQLVIAANADIFFDESLEKLKYINFNIYNVALTRYDYYKPVTLIPDENCHDTWIFRTPIKYQNANYQFNCFGTEHLLVHDWLESGYKVINPCLSVFTHHVHKSEWRDPIVRKGFINHPIYPLFFETLLESIDTKKVLHTINF